MQSVEKFTHVCDGLNNQPIMRYSIIHSHESQRQLCWGNLLIDEQFVLSANGDNPLDESTVPDILSGIDYYACDSVVYFFPKQYIEKVKLIITQKIQQWKLGQDSGIFYDLEGDMYIGFRETKNGLWVLTYDGSSSVCFEATQSMFDEHFTIQQVDDDDLDYSLPIVAYNVEESSGEYFFNYFYNEYRSFFKFMKSEKLFDSKCYLEK